MSFGMPTSEGNSRVQEIVTQARAHGAANPTDQYYAKDWCQLELSKLSQEPGYAAAGDVELVKRVLRELESN